MNPWITVVPIVVGILISVIGWLVARNHTLNQLVETQRETIGELRRQVDRFEVTAAVVDRVLNQLPQPRAPEGTR